MCLTYARFKENPTISVLIRVQVQEPIVTPTQSFKKIHETHFNLRISPPVCSLCALNHFMVEIPRIFIIFRASSAVEDQSASRIFAHVYFPPPRPPQRKFYGWSEEKRI